MEHILDEDFWKSCAKLPPNIQRRVPQKFQLLQQNPRHPSLRFKKVRTLWSIRISKGDRALAREKVGFSSGFGLEPMANTSGGSDRQTLRNLRKLMVFLFLLPAVELIFFASYLLRIVELRKQPEES